MNSTGNITAAAIDTIIQENYASYVYSLTLISSMMLLFYAILLKLSQEIEHMWRKPLGLPSILYIFGKYGTLVQQGLSIWLAFTPLGRTCNMVSNAANAMSTLSYIGVQGLLIARAYSICQGAKIPSMTLALGFLSNLCLILYINIVYPGCIVNGYTAENIRIAFASCIIGIFIDIIITGICMWKVWGTWKLKREAGIQGSGSLVSVLLRQIISRFCFVIFITVTTSVVTIFETSSHPLIEGSMAYFQNAISALLVTDLTLDLRRQNSAGIEASAITIPALQFSNVLHRVHQSFIAELATPEEQNRGEYGEDDNGSGFMGEIQFIEDLDPPR